MQKTIMTIVAAAVAGFSVCAAEPVGNSVSSITFPAVTIDIPKGPGYETFNARCVVCHSHQYILMQPRFSPEVWTAEVQKMRKVFGAPVGDDQVDEIVNYLVSVRGPVA